MKLAVSNIAWHPDEDEIVIEVMQNAGIGAIEVAPSILWGNPEQVAEREARLLADHWKQQGFDIIACQSLLFNHPHLLVFGSPETRAETLDYLSSMIRLGGWLGAGVLVFGAPGNRRAGALSDVERDRIATDFFRAVGDMAMASNTRMCIEPNPPSYGSDWLCNVDEAATFVQELNHPGVGLHLDAGCIQLSADTDASVTKALRGPGASHFHASEPFLVPLATGEVHARLATLLRSSSYSGYVSLEMRRRPDIDRAREMAAALANLREFYGA